MPDTETLGTAKWPYDPDDPIQTAVVDAEDKKKAEAEAARARSKTTLPDLYDAIKELTSTVGSLAKTVKEMKEVHDKWIKAGKF